MGTQSPSAEVSILAPQPGLRFETARVQQIQLNLPLYATSFIGRDAEIARLTSMLAPDAELRLVLLTGPGGSGTSRLLIEAARRVAPLYRGLPTYVDLAEPRIPASLPDAIVAAAGIGGTLKPDPLTAFAQAIGTNPHLLILDNATHVASSAVDCMVALARRAPNLTIACASRVRIHLPGVEEMAVGPLPLPDTVQEGSSPEPDTLLKIPSVRLLCCLIARIRPDFVLSDANSKAIVQICRRFDGLPLALEMAAACMQILTPSEMAARLFVVDGRSMDGHDIGCVRNDLLPDWFEQAHPGTRAERHHSLRAAFDWSHALVSADARALLRRLAPLVGGATLESIQETVSFPGEDASLIRGALLPALRELVDHHFVQPEVVQAGREGAESTRFTLLNTVRDYATYTLRLAGETEVAYSRAAAHFSEYLARAVPYTWTAESLIWIRRIDAEYENIRGALAWTLARDPVKASALVQMLAWYWMWRRKWAEAEHWSQRLLDASNAPIVHARAWYTTGVLQTWRYEFVAAVDSLEKALEAADNAADPVLRARIRHYITVPLIYSGRLAHVERILGQLAEDPCHPVDDWEAAGHQCVRGLLARARGHNVAALLLLHQAVDRYRSLGEPFGLASSLVELGMQQYLDGDHAAAEATYLEVHRVSEQIGGRPLQARIYFRIAEAVQAQGREAEALDWIEAGLAYMNAQSDVTGAAQVCALASLAVDAGLWALGVQLYASAQADTQGYLLLRAMERSRADKYLARAALALSGAEWSAAHNAGSQVPICDALSEGLSALRRALTSTIPDLHPHLELRMFGMSEVKIGGRTLAMEDWKYAKARDLLFYLVTLGDRTREQIVLDFWPDAGDSGAGRNRMNVAIHYLRRALGNPAWVRFEHGRFGFRPAAEYSCDCDDFFSLLIRAEQIEGRDPEQAEALMSRAVMIPRGDYLADVSDGEWHDEIRRKLRQRRLEAWLRLARLRRRLGRPKDAVAAYAQALAIDPFEEEIYRGLLRAHADRHDILQIKQVFRHMCEFFEDEFGAPPSPSLVQLYQDLVAGLRTAG